MVPPVTADMVVAAHERREKEEQNRKNKEENEGGKQKEEQFEETEAERLTHAALRDVIAAHPNACLNHDTSATQVWHASALSSAKLVALNRLVPVKSREKYDRSMNMFEEWCKEVGIEVGCIGCDDLLAWIEVMTGEGGKYKLSSIWSMLSGIKCMLLYKYHIDCDAWKDMINKYMRERKKDLSEQPRQNNVFDCVDIEKVWKLDESQYVNHKLAFVLGLYGALRKQDYVDLSHDQFTVMRSMCLCVFCIFFFF